MRTQWNFRGYRTDFLGRDFKVPFPTLSEELAKEVATVKRARKDILKYSHYSLIQHAARRFPILTASNINGKTFQKIRRKDIFKSGSDEWEKDPRIADNHQFGMELYRAEKSDFDRGHMVKREDVQWGREVETAREAAQLTYYFTNSVPQHKNLNQRAWRKLEDFILKKEVMGHGLKINLFTGPVLSSSDPLFVTEVNGERVKIPTLFWKVVYFRNPQKELARIGFLMGQENVLLRENIVKKEYEERSNTRGFSDFEDGDTYQVNVSLIERLTHLSFPKAIDPYEDERPNKLVIQEVQVRGLDPEEASGSLEGLVF